MAAVPFEGYSRESTVLGEGGFATVHLATSDASGEAYAIKVFTSENGTAVDEEKAANELAVLEAAQADLKECSSTPCHVE